MSSPKTSPRPEHTIPADSGVILLDHSLKIVAFDKGAAAILKDQDSTGNSSRPSYHLPKDILNTIRNCKISTISNLRMELRLVDGEYTCRAFLLNWQNWLSTQPMIAVYLEKVLTSNDAIYDVGVRYQLTAREQEVLRGISLGLSSKVMADRMDISPNTVKAFLRLIMIKMGVTSRAGIVANILSRTTLDKGGVVRDLSTHRFEFPDTSDRSPVSHPNGDETMK